MNRFRLLLLVGVFGCAASEGGVVGSGISSVSGNVMLVQEEAAVQTPTDVSLPFPIRVNIVGSAVGGDTDEEGNFELTGEFSGEVTLRFFDARADRRLGDFRLEVPAGSTTVLQNIAIALGAMTVQPEIVQQFDFLGRVEMAECESNGSGVLLVRDEGPVEQRRQFLVRLFRGTDIRRDGRALLCEDLRPRDLLLIDAVLLSDRTVAASQIVVSPLDRPMPGLTDRPIAVRGRVARVSCAAGGMEVEESQTDQLLRQRIRFVPGTRFVCLEPDERACACEDIRAGDGVAIVGTIRTNRPGAVEATLVMISIRPRQVTFNASVLRKFCADGVVQVENGDRDRITLLLSSMTTIACGAPPVPCRCEDIPIDRTIAVQGTLRVERPGVVEATVIRTPG